MQLLHVRDPSLVHLRKGWAREWHAWSAGTWRRRKYRHKRHVRHGEDGKRRRACQGHEDGRQQHQAGQRETFEGDAALHNGSSEAWNCHHADEQGDGEEDHLGHRTGTAGRPFVRWLHVSGEGHHQTTLTNKQQTETTNTTDGT